MTISEHLIRPTGATEMTLIEQLERADGPDRELDRAIAKVMGWHRVEPRFTRSKHGAWISPDDWIGECANGSPIMDSLHGTTMYREVPAYTASIDAAMTLGRDDWDRADMMLTAMGALGNPDYMKAGTWLKMLPIHLCLAALRARSQGGE